MKKHIIAAISIFIFTTLYADQHEPIFTKIYTNAVWGKNKEGVGHSGGGSELKNCLQYISCLEDFIKKHNIQTIVDAGCGDWEFSRHVDWNGADYIGYDVVAHVIEKNIQQYASATTHFIHRNCIKDDLPAADLFICKHVLQHLPNNDIIQLIAQLHKFKYCLITNEVDPRTKSSNGADITVGQTHFIDLTKAPFYLTGKVILSYVVDGGLHQVLLIDNTQN